MKKSNECSDIPLTRTDSCAIIIPDPRKKEGTIMAGENKDKEIEQALEYIARTVATMTDDELIEFVGRIGRIISTHE